MSRLTAYDCSLGALKLREMGWDYREIAKRFDFSERTARRSVKIGKMEEKLAFKPDQFNDWWRETRDKFNRDRPYMVEPIVDFVDYAESCADDYLINREETAKKDGADKTDDSQHDEFDDLL